MTTKEIATCLADYCRKGDFDTAQKELYADDVISIEPYSTPEFDKEIKGLPAVIEKGNQFIAMVETIHGLTVSEPLIAGNAIAFTLTMDLTMKGKPRTSSSEICVYQVKDGKVISEQFFV